MERETNQRLTPETGEKLLILEDCGAVITVQCYCFEEHFCATDDNIQSLVERQVDTSQGGEDRRASEIERQVDTSQGGEDGRASLLERQVDTSQSGEDAMRQSTTSQGGEDALTSELRQVPTQIKGQDLTNLKELEGLPLDPGTDDDPTQDAA